MEIKFKHNFSDSYIVIEVHEVFYSDRNTKAYQGQIRVYDPTYSKKTSLYKINTNIDRITEDDAYTDILNLIDSEFPDQFNTAKNQS